MLSRLRRSAILLILLWASSAQAATITVPVGVDTYANGTAFQNALNTSACGDTIVLQAGVVFKSAPSQAFLLTDKPTCTTGMVTVTSSGSLPAEGVRIDPPVHGAALPQLVGNAYGTFQGAVRAHHWRLVGLDITVSAGYTPDVVMLDTQGSSPNGYPTRDELFATHDITIDRCFIHPPEIDATHLSTTLTTRSAGRGIAAQGVNISILNSWIGGFAGYYPVSVGIGANVSIDSYGIYSVAGPGPLTIDNNYIEANFNNIFIGGGDPPSANVATLSNATATQATFSKVQNLQVGDLVGVKTTGIAQGWRTVKVTAINGSVVTYAGYGPSALTTVPDMPGDARWRGDLPVQTRITRNALIKRPEWVTQGFGAQHKAFIEIKLADGLVIDQNEMAGGYPGAALALTSRNQGGSAPWSTIKNFSVTRNKLRHPWGTWLVQQLEDNQETSTPGGHGLYEGNLAEPPGVGGPNLYGYLMSTQGGTDVTLRHNTWLGATMAAVIAGNYYMGNPSLTFRDNIFFNGTYGLNCQVGTQANCWPGLVQDHDVAIDSLNVQPSWPGSTVVASAAAVGFVDYANGNFRLAPTSPFHNAASDGTDIGANIDALPGGTVVTPPPPPPAPPAACADGADNDGDGLVDLADPGCTNNADTDETNAPVPPPTTTDTVAPDVSLRVTRSGNSNNYTVTATTTATDAVRADFYVDGQQKGLSTVTPYSAKVLISAPGNHMVKVELRDAAGNVGQASKTVVR